MIQPAAFIGILLLYLKYRKDKKKKPEEMWFLRWAP